MSLITIIDLIKNKIKQHKVLVSVILSIYCFSNFCVSKIEFKYLYNKVQSLQYNLQQIKNENNNLKNRLTDLEIKYKQLFFKNVFFDYQINNLKRGRI